MIKKAVIPAAGYGTRFLPITKALPKELLPIIDRPTIEYIVNEAIEAGMTDILLIVSSNKNAIIDYFDYNYPLCYSVVAFSYMVICAIMLLTFTIQDKKKLKKLREERDMIDLFRN